MHPARHTLRQPPWQRTAAGELRRVGVELEMSGLKLDALACCVADFLHATVEPRGRYERVLKGDPAGDWVVELDFNWLKKLGRAPRAADTLSDELGRTAEDALAWVAETVVPVEVVSPPLPLDRLGEVEALIVRLRQAGATGTSDSVINAFSMQFNAEVPGEDAGVIAAYLKAFLCLYDWLYARADINITRRVMNYVDPFPLDYVRKVVAPRYWPDLPTLIDDYLADNPTRNRALDMLPLFLHLDAARVRRLASDELIRPRPAFHYRLPDCDIHVAEWGLYLAWNDWVEVERLAADAVRLDACCAAYCEFLARPLERWLGGWKHELEQAWLGR